MAFPQPFDEVDLKITLMEGEVMHHALSTVLDYDIHCLATGKYEDETGKALWQAEITDLKSLISKLEAVLPKE